MHFHVYLIIYFTAIENHRSRWGINNQANRILGLTGAFEGLLIVFAVIIIPVFRSLGTGAVITAIRCVFPEIGLADLITAVVNRDNRYIREPGFQG